MTKPSYGPERRAEADQAVARATAYLMSEGRSAEGTVLHGDPADLIACVARDKNADLIVTSSHGRTGLERVLLGSTAERILNDTPCAVMVAKVR